MTITKAAELLGISPGAVRKRVQRGKLPAYKADDDTWRVVLNQHGQPRTTQVDNGRTPYDNGGITGVMPSDYLLTHLQQEVAFLHTQVERHPEAERELRVLLAQQREVLPAPAPPDLDPPAAPLPAGKLPFL